MDCPYCNGNGELETARPYDAKHSGYERYGLRRDPEEHREGNKYTVICYVCNGTGYLDHN